MTRRRTHHISTLGSRLTSMASVMLVLLLIGIACLAGVVATGVQNDIRRNLGFVVVMQRDSDNDQQNIVKRFLLANKGVESFDFKSADNILAQESELMGEDIAAMAGGNPFTAEFSVRLKPGFATVDSLTAVSDIAATLPGVEEVVSESEIISGIDTTMRRAGLVLGGLGLFMLVVSVALINNTVSLSIYGRRFVIHTMRLVGATNGFIRRPFVRSACASGLVSGFVAGLLLLAARYYLPTLDATFNRLVTWTDVVVISASMPLAGALLCSLTACVAANRYLRASYDEMFMK